MKSRLDSDLLTWDGMVTDSFDPSNPTLSIGKMLGTAISKLGKLVPFFCGSLAITRTPENCKLGNLVPAGHSPTLLFSHPHSCKKP
jgi:hypothetical protein